MKDRPYIQRSLCRRALRRNTAAATTTQREMIRVALADRAIFETVYEQAMHAANQFATETGTFTITTDEDGSPIVDNLLKLLTWFLENGPELVEMIELIIGLFGSAKDAAAASDFEHGVSS